MSIIEEFRNELQKSFRDYDYQWSSGKEISCQWIMERIHDGNIADIGGTQWLLERLAENGVRCTYFDAFPPKAPINKNIDVRTGDLHEIADILPRESFDHIVLRHTLEHALNPLIVLWQVNLLLRSKGTAIIVLPCHNNYWIWFYTHFNCIPVENWRMLFFRAGFDVIEEATGNWHDDQRNPAFMEHRFVLRPCTRSLRLHNP